MTHAAATVGFFGFYYFPEVCPAALR